MAWRIPLSISSAFTALDLDDTDSAFVAQGVVLASTEGSGIVAGGMDQDIVVHGTVVGLSGIRLTTSFATSIEVGVSGRVVGLSGPGVLAEGQANRIVNNGVIETLATGAAAVSIVSNPGPAFQYVVNRGTIEGDNGIVANGTGVMSLNNSGTIQSMSLAYADVGGHTDTFTNTGRIVGHVSLGDGNDLFDSRGGTHLSGAISGGSGSDRLYAGAGSNTLLGDSGNDTLMGGASGDSLDGGADVDTASYASAAAGVRASLVAASGNTGDAKGDSYFDIEGLVGSRFADTLVGNAAANQLTGGAGADTLTGGGGADRFVFATAPGGTASADRITDFATDFDELRLDDVSFRGLAMGHLAEGAFWASATGTAHDATDRVLYETDTGWLRFDADGNGAGAAVAFAKLALGLRLGADDFFVY